MSGQVDPGALALGLRFVWFAWQLRNDERWAMPTFRFSIVHLFGLFALLLVDHYGTGWVA